MIECGTSSWKFQPFYHWISEAEWGRYCVDAEADSRSIVIGSAVGGSVGAITIIIAAILLWKSRKEKKYLLLAVHQSSSGNHLTCVELNALGCTISYSMISSRDYSELVEGYLLLTLGCNFFQSLLNTKWSQRCLLTVSLKGRHEIFIRIRSWVKERSV